MNIDEFTRSCQGRWKRLSDLLTLSESSLSRVSPEQLIEMGQLYRAATSDLALAQRDFPRHRVTMYLNQLVGRAHGVVYGGEPLALKRIRSYIARGFPQAFRQSGRYTLTAALLLFIPAILSGLVVWSQPSMARWLLPPQYQSVIPELERGNLWTEIPIAERPYASSAIMTNNIQVSFVVFGGGMLAGLLTVYALIFNGVSIGGMVGLTSLYGVGWDLVNFMVGHGVIELSVIAMAGGCGLRIGHAMIQPGLLRRRDAVVQAAISAVRLLIGCVPLLVIAGTIEGFISPNEFIPWPFKWAVGLSTGVVLYAYLLLLGRDDEPSVAGEAIAG
jgi:uncharacterized membrane protein SpoIIM required for sporulation